MCDLPQATMHYNGVELSAEHQMLSTELAELKTRHAEVLNQLRAAQNTTLEDKLTDTIKSFVRVAVEDAMEEATDIDTIIENFLERHIDDYVRDAIDSLSFEVSIR